MREDTRYKLIVWVALILYYGGLMLLGYVVVHFAGKYW